MGILACMDRRRWRGLMAAAIVAAMGGAAAQAQPLFTEQSQAAGVATSNVPGIGFILSGIQDISHFLGAGAAADFNNDGWQDLYVVSGGGVPDRLYMNNGDGTFTDTALAAGLAQPHMGIGVAAGDYNRDGWIDLYVTSLGPPNGLPMAGQHKLYRNNGNGTFTNVAAAAGVSNIGIDGMGPAFGDYDLDGDLDLFVPGWLNTGNHMFRNNGNGTFTQVTNAAGVFDLEVHGFSAIFADMNGDRYPELLVAGDFKTSRYYKNNLGTFINYTKQSGTGLDGNGMGHAVGDFNNDNLPDWYVTSVYSSNSGMPGVPGTGNMLYMNQGNHTFTEASHKAGVYDGGWGWGTVAVDLDHDQWTDLVETNGYHLPNGASQYEWLNEPTYLWLNNHDGTFTEDAQGCGLVDTLQGRGLINLDYDNDGDQDIVQFNNSGPLHLFRNDLVHGPNTHWLRVLLNTQGNPHLAPNGYGSVVKVTAGGQLRKRAINGGSSFMSQSELSAHFGLGSIALIDEIRINWNDGTSTVLQNLPADQSLTIASGFISDITGNGAVNLDDLLSLISAWGPAQPGGHADQNADGIIDVSDLLILLQNWG